MKNETTIWTLAAMVIGVCVLSSFWHARDMKATAAAHAAADLARGERDFSRDTGAAQSRLLMAYDIELRTTTSNLVLATEALEACERDRDMLRFQLRECRSERDALQAPTRMDYSIGTNEAVFHVPITAIMMTNRISAYTNIAWPKTVPKLHLRTAAAWPDPGLRHQWRGRPNE